MGSQRPKSAETSFPYEFIQGKDTVVPTTLLMVILRPKALEVYCGQFE